MHYLVCRRIMESDMDVQNLRNEKERLLSKLEQVRIGKMHVNMD